MKNNVKTLKEIKKGRKPIKNPNKIKREGLSIPNRIALYITNKVGTFGFFIFCVCLTVIPFIVPSTMQVVMFISSSFLQLVLLPLIMIGQNIQSKHAELRADAIYDVSVKLDDEMDNIHQYLENNEEILKEILKKIDNINKPL